ncbi:MAG: DUF4170 domain-containing protein [Alphaproteobacteria bacterium]|nr:DUF4170 domain-containing protein [Alphaproteobacteria bacterium]
MERYWVIGGEYTDTSFTSIVGGDVEQRYGPFESYDKAKAIWAGLSMAQVDNAHVRFRIEHEGVSQFWVVGGTYTSTDFTSTVGGAPEDRIGPFESYEDALTEWRKQAWATADNGLVRYRIEQK